MLVNTYSGVLKISDFGTSTRLAGMNPTAETFAGSYMHAHVRVETLKHSDTVVKSFSMNAYIHYVVYWL